jgi:hypothetical protein
MFWLIDNNILDNYVFIMNFLDYDTYNIENNILYIFNNTIHTRYNISIICNIKIKDNIILYEFDDKKICFSFVKEEIFNDPKIKYYYKKENIEKMPYLLSNKYDFNENITFNIDNSNEKILIINENINNNIRNYNIVKNNI